MRILSSYYAGGVATPYIEFLPITQLLPKLLSPGYLFIYFGYYTVPSGKCCRVAIWSINSRLLGGAAGDFGEVWDIKRGKHRSLTKMWQ